MRKILTITMLALLVAGAATVILADSYWTGDATGNCGGNSILVNWEGTLYTEYEGFDGFWNYDSLNLMQGAAYEWGVCWVVDSSNSYWDSGGESYNFVGVWAACFGTDGDMNGAWWGNVACTDGALEGEEQ